MTDSNQSHLPYDLSGHVALVTGANHGIGAATAQAFARCGAAVVITYLSLTDDPAAYRANRAQDGSAIVAAIRSSGGRAVAQEVDLRETALIPKLFDFAETEFGPVDILVNNATGWVADTFVAGRAHVDVAPIWWKVR